MDFSANGSGIVADIGPSMAPFSTAQTGMSPAMTNFSFTTRVNMATASPADMKGQTEAAGVGLQSISPAMLSRIPTVLLGIYVINSVLASHRSTSRDRIPASGPGILPGLTADHEKRAGTLEGVSVTDGLSIRQILAPRKFHLRPKRLMKKLGEDFQASWMSVEQPVDFMNVTIGGRKDPEIADQWVRSVNPWTLMKSLTALNIGRYDPSNKTGDPWTNGKPNRRQADYAVQSVMSAVQDWLVEKATCPVRYIWEDLGTHFWPRYVRRGFCTENTIPDEVKTRVQSSLTEERLIEQDCSWPPGMFCVSGDAKLLRILSWKCQPSRGASRKRKGSAAFPGMSTEPRLGPEISEHGRMSDASDTKGSFQRTLESFGSGRRYAATGSLRKGRGRQQPQTADQEAKNTQEDSEKAMSDGHDLSSILSKIKSRRSRRSVAYPEELAGYMPNYMLPQRDSALPDTSATTKAPERRGYSHLSWKELRKKFKTKCRWQKITLPPVTEFCHCSC